MKVTRPLFFIVLLSTALVSCRGDGTSSVVDHSMEMKGTSADSTAFDVKGGASVNLVMDESPISLRTGIKNLMAQVEAKKSKSELQCAAIQEIEGLIVCVSAQRATSLAPFTRASIFNEGRPSLRVPFVGKIVTITDAQKGWDSSASLSLSQSNLQKFFSALSQQCSNQNCMGPSERVLNQNFMQRLQKTFPRGYTIVSLDVSPESLRNFATHEIARAQFLQQAGYRDAVIAWYKSLNISEKNAAKTYILAKYDAGSEDVLMNAIHAFVLDGTLAEDSQKMADAQRVNTPESLAFGFLMHNSQTLKQRLQDALKRAGQSSWSGQIELK
jgi:hypothetical protein